VARTTAVTRRNTRCTDVLHISHHLKIPLIFIITMNIY
jgi:hypothetical protein